jgi:antitoxin (DNA-binding transcriptional repressor) of toxin-antitoxin stability system
MDEVQAKRETVVITKRAKPVAQLVPVEPEGDDIFGFLRGKGTIAGDVRLPLHRKNGSASIYFLNRNDSVLLLALTPSRPPPIISQRHPCS